MIVRNGSSALTEVHFDGHSEKQVFVGNYRVWPTIDWNKYSFSVYAYPIGATFDAIVSRNVDGITGMVIQDAHFGDFIEITPSTKISVADMNYINYKALGVALHIGYVGNHISANMFDASLNDTIYNHIHIQDLIIYKNLDYIGDNAFKSEDDDYSDILYITFGQNVTKIPSLSPTALPKKFLISGTINVPKSLEDAFKNADVWKNYADIIEGY